MKLEYNLDDSVPLVEGLFNIVMHMKMYKVIFDK